jgi:hypothetical protein
MPYFRTEQGGDGFAVVADAARLLAEKTAAVIERLSSAIAYFPIMYQQLNVAQRTDSH